MARVVFGASILLHKGRIMAPRKIIILRHGEKKKGNPFELCSTGLLRSLALRDQYLGQGASNAGLIFDDGETPDAFFAITMHTLDLVSPSAQSWGKPVIDYSVMPTDVSPPSAEDALNARTQQAAKAVLSGAWDGKTVVMVWEHKHIANKKLETKCSEPVTLRQLFGLDGATGDHVPHTWSGFNYDFFWVVTRENGTPKFKSHLQAYTGTYKDVPQNPWKVRVDLPSDCEQEKSEDEDDDVAPASAT
jgi:hypothetical protein